LKIIQPVLFHLTELPPIESLYSKLSKQSIKQEDYEYAKKIWVDFDCKMFKDYMLLYLKTDVLLLADVFESFRDLYLSDKTGYGLYPCHYFIAPGMGWDASLKRYGGS
jgi:hypothetical protein